MDRFARDLRGEWGLLPQGAVVERPLATTDRPAPFLWLACLRLAWGACLLGPWLLLGLLTARFDSSHELDVRLRTLHTWRPARWYQLQESLGPWVFAWGWVGPFRLHALVANALAALLLTAALGGVLWRARARAEGPCPPWLASGLWPALGVVPWSLSLLFMGLEHVPLFEWRVARVCSAWPLDRVDAVVTGWPLARVWLHVLALGLAGGVALGPCASLLWARRRLARRFGRVVVRERDVVFEPVDFVPYRLAVPQRRPGRAARLPGVLLALGGCALMLVAVARLGPAWSLPALAALSVPLGLAHHLWVPRASCGRACAAGGLIALAAAVAWSTPPFHARASIIDSLGNGWTVVSRPGEPTWFAVLGEAPDPLPLPGRELPSDTRLLVVPLGAGPAAAERGLAVPERLGIDVWACSPGAGAWPTPGGPPRPWLGDLPCLDPAWLRFCRGETSRAWVRLQAPRGGDELGLLVERGRLRGVFLGGLGSPPRIRWEGGRWVTGGSDEDLARAPGEAVPFAPFAHFFLLDLDHPVLRYPGELPTLAGLLARRAEGQTLEEQWGHVLPFWQLDLPDVDRSRARGLAADWRRHVRSSGVTDPPCRVPTDRILSGAEGGLTAAQAEQFELSVLGLAELARFGATAALRREAVEILAGLGEDSRLVRCGWSRERQDAVTTLALDALGSAVEDPVVQVRDRAVRALALWGFMGPEEQAVVCRRLREDPAVEVRVSAVAALKADLEPSSLFWPEESVPALCQAAGSDAAVEVRLFALSALQCSAPLVPTCTALRALLEHPDPHTRYHAAAAILRVSLYREPTELERVAGPVVDALLTPPPAEPTPDLPHVTLRSPDEDVPALREAATRALLRAVEPRLVVESIRERLGSGRGTLEGERLLQRALRAAEGEASPDPPSGDAARR